MKIRKPRTKEQPQRMNERCPYYDGMIGDRHVHECLYPWNSKCEGQSHRCYKLKLQWLASLSDKKRKVMQEKFSR